MRISRSKLKRIEKRLKPPDKSMRVSITDTAKAIKEYLESDEPFKPRTKKEIEQMDPATQRMYKKHLQPKDEGAMNE